MKTVNALVKSLFVLATGFLIAGCSTIFGPPDREPPAATFEPEPYRIGVGDSITINVWRNPELSQNVGVRPDGYISMPLMGDLKAADRRPEELALEINNALSSVIRNPEVTVIVNNPTSQDYRNRVRATGQVGSPTSVPHRPGMTVMDLVLEAGGISPFGAANRAELKRVIDGESQSFAVRLNDIMRKGDLRTNYELLPGDVITVPEKQLLRGEL